MTTCSCGRNIPHCRACGRLGVRARVKDSTVLSARAGRAIKAYWCQTCGETTSELNTCHAFPVMAPDDIIKDPVRYANELISQGKSTQEVVDTLRSLGVSVSVQDGSRKEEVKELESSEEKEKSKDVPSISMEEIIKRSKQGRSDG